ARLRPPRAPARAACRRPEPRVRFNWRNPMQGLLALFYGFGVWNWLILAVLLFVLEFLVPGVHFLWFGIAAVVVGALAMGTGMIWQYQIIAFAVISVLTVFGVRRLFRAETAHTDQPDLNIRGQQYVGRSLVVAEPIQNG